MLNQYSDGTAFLYTNSLTDIIPGGSLVLSKDVCGVAVEDIEPNSTGALLLSGVFKFQLANATGTAVANGSRVYVAKDTIFTDGGAIVFSPDDEAFPIGVLAKAYNGYGTAVYVQIVPFAGEKGPMGERDIFTPIETSTENTLTIVPGGAVQWTPEGDGTLAVSGGVDGQKSYANIDITLGASNAITLASGLSWASPNDSLASLETNHCVVVFNGGSAMLAVCDNKDEGGGGSSTIPIDTELNPDSPNPVANSALYAEFGGKANLDSNGKVQESELPIAGGTLGGVRQGTNVGVKINGTGAPYIDMATDNEITSRSTQYKPIVPSNLNSAVTAALTDANHLTLTDAQKASAQSVLGASPAPIVSSGAPTSATVGSVGQLYVDTSTSKTYHCTGSATANDTTTYAWTDDINEKGGTFTNDISIGGGASGSAQSYRYLIIGRNNTVLSQYNWRRMLVVGENNNIGAGDNRIIVGYSNNINNFYNGSVIGNNLISRTSISGTYGKILAGGYNVQDSDAVILVGNGTSSKSDNAASLSLEGNLWISGSYQARKTIIPAGTSSYTLNDGHFSHTPSNASTYVLPDVYPMLVVDNTLCVRKPSADGTGYYGWLAGTTNRYTSSATPAVGTNTYTNTALTAGAKPVTAIDRRTHEIVLTVRFSSTALSCAFQDAAGNTLTPLPLAGTIADGSVVCYRCTWEELLGRWVIMPVMLGTYSAGV